MWNLCQGILAQMQFGDFREAAKGLLMDALNFVDGQVEYNEIPDVPEMLVVYLRKEILL